MKPNSFFKQWAWLNPGSELTMITFVIGILLILFIPIPASLLDFLLIMNLSWALTVLLLTFYNDKPLSFSTFPALLLISTLFRLALNVSATRLILSLGDAGRVIQTIGQYVIHGNYVMGLVVFFILIIVQYIVVTNGSQRIAEVAARFTLDSIPGKQMSIDADLNMGLISQNEARFRRQQIEKEANFYGAMDGASKFVKGDAIAGILILLVDILGGFAIGMMQKSLSFTESIHTYTLLTVGDGLVTQIPALIISTATGIIVTRAATDAQLSNEVAKQISSYPKSLVMVCLSLIGILFIKGIPAFPVLIIFGFFAVGAWYAFQPKNQDAAETEENLYEKIRIYPIEIHLNAELFSTVHPFENTFVQRCQQIRERLAYELGFVIPEIKLVIDKQLNYPFYSICIQGNRQGQNSIHFDKVLAIFSQKKSQQTPSLIQGIETRDPSFGLPAIWINSNQKEEALAQGYTVFDPLNVLTTHLNEVLHNHLAELLTRAETEILLGQMIVCTLRDELIPTLLSLSQVQQILQGLLQEQVSIRSLALILEILLEHAKQIIDPTQLTELVRARLGGPICQKLIANQTSLPVLILAPAVEQILNQSFIKDNWALEPHTTEQFLSSLATQCEKMLSERKKPVLLCSSLLRKPIKRLTERIIPHLTVLAMNEIPVHIAVDSFAIINLN